MDSELLLKFNGYFPDIFVFFFNRGSVDLPID